MANPIDAIKGALQKRAEKNQRKKHVGVSWITEKKLKHDYSKTIKQHRLFGHDLYYASANDLLHVLEELFVEEIYKAELGPKPFIIDCGANIGLSVLYFKTAYPEAKVIAFEPDRLNFSLLEKNVRSFGLRDVEIRQQAIWKEAATLNFSGSGDLSGFISEASNGWDGYEVAAVPLAPVIDKQVDFLKIDIEGAEYEVMHSIKDSLHLVSNLFLEYHSKFEEAYKLNELFQMVTAAGFSYYIKECFSVYPTPFYRDSAGRQYDIQLNIFCFRKQS